MYIVLYYTIVSLEKVLRSLEYDNVSYALILSLS